MSEVKGFKLVPASMLLDKGTIGAINFHCGDGGDNFGEHSDGLLWVGTVTDDDGKEVYGLHLSTAEYPEEGSSTLIEFDPPEDAAQSELSALREELAACNERKAWWVDSAKTLDERLTAAEQRNSVRDIESAAKVLANCMDYPWDHMPENGRVLMRKHAKDVIDAALKPTESGASE